MKKKPNLALLGILWLFAIALFVAAVVLYHDTRLSHRSGGFPYMPFYGAITWWLFLTIPLIGWTWGTLNDLKNDGMHLDQALRHPEEEPER